MCPLHAAIGQGKNVSQTYVAYMQKRNHWCDVFIFLSKASGKDCVNGHVRLRDGANEMEGRVEVCLDGVWGSICDNKWSDPDASVVCKQLGFSTIGLPCKRICTMR